MIDSSVKFKRMNCVTVVLRLCQLLDAECLVAFWHQPQGEHHVTQQPSDRFADAITYS